MARRSWRPVSWSAGVIAEANHGRRPDGTRCCSCGPSRSPARGRGELLPLVPADRDDVQVDGAAAGEQVVPQDPFLLGRARARRGDMLYAGTSAYTFRYGKVEKRWLISSSTPSNVAPASPGTRSPKRRNATLQCRPAGLCS